MTKIFSEIVLLGTITSKMIVSVLVSYWYMAFMFIVRNAL